MRCKSVSRGKCHKRCVMIFHESGCGVTMAADTSDIFLSFYSKSVKGERMVARGLAGGRGGAKVKGVQKKVSECQKYHKRCVKLS